MSSSEISSSIQPSGELRKAILKIFTHKYSLQLHSSALSFIAGTLDSHGLLDQPDEWNEAIDALAMGIVENEGNIGGADGDGFASVVTRESLSRVYDQLVVADTAATSQNQHHEITDGEVADPDRYFHVIDAFKMPRVTYDQKRKVFEKVPTPPTILPPASAKPAHLRERLNLIRSIVLRNHNFLPPLALGQGKERDAFMKLTSTKNLLGRQGQRFLLFGILSTAEDGQYCLEDPDGTVGLDMEEAVPGEGIFTEGSIILVEGEYTEEERIKVDALGHPPPESRSAGREICGHVDFLGTGGMSIKEEENLKFHEKSHPDLCMVVISDLHLDHPKTMANFKRMLQGYVEADFLPFAFILCGNFSSSPFVGPNPIKRYQDSFSQLADLLLQFPTILRFSHFIFVPGPHDPFTSPLLPRASIPEILLTRLKNRLGPRAKLHFTSNPCRIRYFSQEIVIYRDDVMSRMLRNTVRLKEEAKEIDLKKFLVSTLLDQAHLCPLTQQVRPVLWEFDHALRLYPMPTALVIADKYDRFELIYEGCQVFNPGSFRGSSFGWTTYYPATGRAERSELPPL